jgi:hypothetical protein
MKRLQRVKKAWAKKLLAAGHRVKKAMAKHETMLKLVQDANKRVAGMSDRVQILEAKGSKIVSKQSKSDEGAIQRFLSSNKKVTHGKIKKILHPPLANLRAASFKMKETQRKYL